MRQTWPFDFRRGATRCVFASYRFLGGSSFLYRYRYTYIETVSCACTLCGHILTSVTDGYMLMHASRSYASCDHVTLPIAAFFCACDLAWCSATVSDWLCPSLPRLSVVCCVSPVLFLTSLTPKLEFSQNQPVRASSSTFDLIPLVNTWYCCPQYYASWPRVQVFRFLHLAFMFIAIQQWIGSIMLWLQT